MNPMNPFEKFQHFANCVEIVHHIPGRIRLRLAMDDLSSLNASLSSLLEQAGDFKKVLDRLPGIRSVRVNALARSCTVEYDPALIPLPAWTDFLAGASTPAADRLRQTITETCAEVFGG